jgi:hypothetical protein
MSVYEINPIRDPRWAEFVENCPTGSVFHMPSWLKALAGTYGYEPVALTTTGPSQPLQNGLVCCPVKSLFTGSRIVSLPFSDHCQPLFNTAADLLELLGHLRNVVAAKNWKYLELRPALDLSSQITSEAELVESASFCLHSLDLQPSEDAMFRNFHKTSVQQMIRRAEKEGLTSEGGRSGRLLKMFYELLLLTRRRHQLPPQPQSWFRNLIQCFGERLAIRVAFKDGRPVASMLTLFDGKTLTYKYGCSDARFHSLGGMPFLFWHAIKDGKRARAEQFDFGRSEKDNSGLIAFKDHWGGSRKELKYYRYSTRPSENGAKQWQMDAARKTFSKLPDFCLTTAGKLLYKHIG